MVLIGWLGLMTGWSEAATLVIGRPAPLFKIVTLQGHVESNADWAGKVVMLAFIASWCPPCQQELPVLASYAAKHPGKFKLVVIALDDPDDLKDLQAMTAGLNLDLALSATTEAVGYGRIWRLPVSFVIDAQGNLAYNGWKDEHPVWTRERLRQQITPLIIGTHAIAKSSVVLH